MSSASLGPSQLYDVIGGNYTAYRQPDVRIARRIRNALGDAGTVVNVGAGAGAYEPAELDLVAVEPSREMIRQRGRGRAPAVQASAAALPFRDASFDAALAILTVHHWTNRTTGLLELRRVARRRVVILTWDPDESCDFWLDEYLPEIRMVDRMQFPTRRDFAAAFGSVEFHSVMVPADCTDGFMGAYWKRPAAYLDPGVRGAISTFSKIGDVSAALRRLEADLRSGIWARKNAKLAALDELDLGYRLIVAPSQAPSA